MYTDAQTNNANSVVQLDSGRQKQLQVGDLMETIEPKENKAPHSVWDKLLRDEAVRLCETDGEHDFGKPDRGFQVHPRDQADGFYQ